MQQDVTSGHCKRCGRVVLQGEIDLIPAQLDFTEMEQADAQTLMKWGILVAQVKIKQYGNQRSVIARWYWPEPSEDWICLPLHRCFREEVYTLVYSSKAMPDLAGQSTDRLHSPVHAIRRGSPLADSECPPF